MAGDGGGGGGGGGGGVASGNTGERGQRAGGSARAQPPLAATATPLPPSGPCQQRLSHENTMHPLDPHTHPFGTGEGVQSAGRPHTPRATAVWGGYPRWHAARPARTDLAGERGPRPGRRETQPSAPGPGRRRRAGACVVVDAGRGGARRPPESSGIELHLVAICVSSLAKSPSSSSSIDMAEGCPFRRRRGSCAWVGRPPALCLVP